jgi:hypothetical protein
MHDWWDRLTSWIAYIMSAFGVIVSPLSMEDWYFISSIAVGVIALLLNVWHKRVMQRIAREKGIYLNEQV